MRQQGIEKTVMIKLKILSSVYYKHKSKFKKLYKSLGMTWIENSKIGDVWANPEKMDSGYIRKLTEENGFKRFLIHNCPEMVSFLKGIGSVEITEGGIEEVVVKEAEPFRNIEFSGHKGFRELLELMPENFGVKWKMEESEKSDFEKKWDKIKVRYAGYSKEDFYREVGMKYVDDVVKKVQFKRKVFKIGK